MPDAPLAVLPKGPFPRHKHEKAAIRVSPLLIELSDLDADTVYARLESRPEGLTGEEADARLAEHGPNILAKDRRPGLGKLLWHAVLNPLVILLGALALVSLATGDARSVIMMGCMIVLGVGLKLFQEAKASSA